MVHTNEHVITVSFKKYNWAGMVQVNERTYHSSRVKFGHGHSSSDLNKNNCKL